MAVLWIAMLGVTASRGGCGGAWTRARPCASPPRRQSVRLLAADEQPQNDVARVKLDGVGRLGRRTTRIDFTCQACGSRTSRMINPEAYRTGVVIVQCASPPCSKHHGPFSRARVEPPVRPLTAGAARSPHAADARGGLLRMRPAVCFAPQ